MPLTVLYDHDVVVHTLGLVRLQCCVSKQRCSPSRFHVLFADGAMDQAIDH